ncbi:hypothetical protein FH972_026030 [Carpinus fangiana]|uniref:pyridoxal kinase n=1 Tax=Carpinus fangiana TaxID=176857 RepID=A0A5N6L3Q8_9ROSI|nr:hypothetical protein FH972_026030 [Carpinus fangiana]
MATFVLQALGCDVSAINTVNFSNHTAYKQFKGRRTPAEEIQEIYNGLKEADLNHFDVMLSGYAASKHAVETIGGIGRDQRLKSSTRPGSFFWILDPVMGDQGRLYVSEDIVPAYRTLIRDADLILPNSFEASQLAEIEVTDMASLVAAITKIHKQYQVPHIIVTSLNLSPRTGRRFSNADKIAVVGSSCCSDYSPRLFSVTVPSLPIFFSGTGDMFASLMLVRLREAVTSINADMLTKKSWQSPDDVPATSLPLAKATEKVLASMQTILEKTVAARDADLADETSTNGESEEDARRMHLRRTRASEVRVVECVQDLQHPDMQQPGVSKAEMVQIDA